MFLLCRTLTFLAVALEVYGEADLKLLPTFGAATTFNADTSLGLFGENTIDVSGRILFSAPSLIGIRRIRYDCRLGDIELQETDRDNYM